MKKNLKFIIVNIITLISLLTSFAIIYNLWNKIKKEKKTKETYMGYYNFTTKILLNDVDNFYKFFKKNNYTKIGVYGYGSIANIFLKKMENNDIDVKFIVDKDSDYYSFGEIPIISISDIDKHDVDILVITPFNYYDEIHTTLIEAGIKTKVISIEKIF